MDDSGGLVKHLLLSGVLCFGCKLSLKSMTLD